MALKKNHLPERMQSAIFHGDEIIRMEQVAVPRPGPGEVLVRLEGCGVCGSNLPVWAGRPWFQYPFEPGAPGHEGWGRIEAVGDGVSESLVGKRVAALSYHAYAEFDLARADQVVELPPALDHLPFPGEPLGCAVNIIKRSEIQPGQQVAIVGIGFLGGLLTSLASHAGARVIAVSRRLNSLQMAQRLGATNVVTMDDHWKVVDTIKGLTDGQGCDRVIECVGEQWPLDLAGDLTRERGRLIIAGYHQDGPRQVNMQMWNWKGLDVINAHERDPQVYVRGMREAVQDVTSGQLDPGPLFTHQFTLDQIVTAFRLLRDRPEGFFKALIRF